MEMQWPLMVFTLFVCLGAGVFAVQGLLALLGKGKELQLWALVVSALSLVVGGVGSFLHLQHWERVFNGFGHLTSGITQELIGIVVFALALVVYFVMLRRSDTGMPPRWCAVLAIIVAVALVVVMALSYNMGAKPVWDTPLLWLYYLSDAAFLGFLAVAMLAGWKEGAIQPASLSSPGAAAEATASVAGTSAGAGAHTDAAGSAGAVEDVDADAPGRSSRREAVPSSPALAARFSARLSWICGLIHALAVAAYAAFFGMAGAAFPDVGYYYDPTHPTKSVVDPSTAFASILAEPVFWLGAVLIGLLVPLALAFLAEKRKPRQLACLCGTGLVCALVGGFCFRAVLYLLGFSVFVFY